jgi:hypothetical protein
MNTPKKVRSFRIYLPGGKVPTSAGLVVVALAAGVMIVGFAEIDSVARALPGVTLGQLKALSVALGFAVIGVGWVVLKVFGVPFSKDETA